MTKSSFPNISRFLLSALASVALTFAVSPAFAQRGGGGGHGGGGGFQGGGGGGFHGGGGFGGVGGFHGGGGGRVLPVQGAE